MKIGIFIYRFIYEAVGSGMAVRTRLIVSGNVQGVGYRTLVKQIANRMRVTGIVRNLPYGNVEVYCQCSDKETLDKFVKQIEIKATTDNVFAVNVDSINSYKEGETDYGEPNVDFKTFIIDYGMDVDQFQKETLERSEIGILLLGGTISGIGEVRSEVGGVRSDIKDMHSDMNVRFDTLDEKYGAIGQQMNILTEELQKSTLSLVTLTGKIGALIDQKLSE